MKLDELRQVIREEITTAMQAELKQILIEAVEIASRPNITESCIEKLPVRKVVKSTPPKEGIPKVGLGSILEATRRDMTQEDYRDIVDGSSTPNISRSTSMAHQLGMMAEGVDITQLDFVKKAKQVLEKAEEKDKERHS